MAAATFDKYETHLLLERLGLPSPPTVLADCQPEHYPVIVKPRRGSNSRSIFLARDLEQARFFVDYAGEPVILQRAMNGPEFSIDCLCDLNARCLNAIPRSMLESRGGESVKGTVLGDRELVELGRAVSEAVGARGACMVQCFRDPELGLRVTDVNVRFGGGYPSHMYGALPGQTYPELIVRMARGEVIEPHVGRLRAGVTFARYYWQLELDEQLNLTGREIVERPPVNS
jgi:carbamoyl-phosphate synthase large subunit